MKLDLTPVRSSYITPTFGGDDRLPMDPALRRRMRHPMFAGAAIIGRRRRFCSTASIGSRSSPPKVGVT